MVKGTSKRVVVVKSPDPKVFEQAIFIVREDFLKKGREEHPGDILKEAQDVADEYIRATVRAPGRRFPQLPPAVFGALGALGAVCVWLVLYFAGVI